MPKCIEVDINLLVGRDFLGHSPSLLTVGCQFLFVQGSKECV